MTISQAVKATNARASLRAATIDLSSKIKQSSEILQAISGKDVPASQQELGEDEKPIVACCQDVTALQQNFDKDVALLEGLEIELAAAQAHARKKKWLIIIGAIAVFIILTILLK